MNHCTGTTNTGTKCKNKCEGIFCKTHMKIHVRENPEVKLTQVDSPNANAIVAIMDKMRNEGKTVVDRGFLEMFVCREIFNPSLNINKFITGGVVEEIITELISKLGFQVTNVASTESVVDIEVVMGEHTIRISLKNSGNIDQQPILENYRGETKVEVRELPPTLIVYTETSHKRARIVYLDHDIIKQAYPDLSPEELDTTVYNRKVGGGDKQASLTFKSGFLKNLIPRLPDAYIVNATFPESIPMTVKQSITVLALDYVRKAMTHATELFEPTPHM